LVLGVGGDVVGTVAQTVGQLLGPVDQLPGAIGQLPSTVGEPPGAVGELLGALGERVGATGELTAAIGQLLGAAGELPGTLSAAVRAPGELIEPGGQVPGAIGAAAGPLGQLGGAPGELVDAASVFLEPVAQTGHAADQLPARGDQARILSGAVTVEGGLDTLGVGDHTLGALDQTGLVLGAVDAIGQLLQLRTERKQLGGTVSEALRAADQARVLGGAVPVQPGVDPTGVFKHAFGLGEHGLRAHEPLRVFLGILLCGVALLRGAGDHLLGQAHHARVLLGAVALEAGRELGGPVRDLLCTFGQSRLLLAAADPVGEQLCALAELGGAVGDVLGGGDQAGILGRPVAGDDRCGLVHSAGELLQSGGQLIGAGLQPRVLGGAVPL